MYLSPRAEGHASLVCHDIATRIIDEYFGDIRVGVHETGTFGISSIVDDADVWLRFRSLPIDSSVGPEFIELSPPCVQPRSADDAPAMYSTPQPNYAGWHKVLLQSGGREVEIATFNGGSNQWHTAMPFSSFESLVYYHKLDLDMVFGDFLRSLTDENWASNAEREREEARITAFEEFLTSQRAAPIETLEGTISEYVRQLSDNESIRNTIVSSLELERANLDIALARLDDPVEVDAKRELDAIRRHVKVRDVYTDEGTLTVLTDNLMLPHPDDYDEPAVLGMYRIEVNFRTSNVSVTNMTNKKGDYDHPHVHGGSFCSGTWSSTILDLIQERQLAALVGFLIDTLEHCNPDDDWGRSYRHWFNAENNDTALESSAFLLNTEGN